MSQLSIWNYQNVVNPNALLLLLFTHFTSDECINQSQKDVCERLGSNFLCSYHHELICTCSGTDEECKSKFQASSKAPQITRFRLSEDKIIKCEPEDEMRCLNGGICVRFQNTDIIGIVNAKCECNKGFIGTLCEQGK